MLWIRLIILVLTAWVLAATLVAFIRLVTEFRFVICVYISDWRRYEHWVATWWVFHPCFLRTGTVLLAVMVRLVNIIVVIGVVVVLPGVLCRQLLPLTVVSLLPSHLFCDGSCPFSHFRSQLHGLVKGWMVLHRIPNVHRRSTDLSRLGSSSIGSEYSIFLMASTDRRRLMVRVLLLRAGQNWFLSHSDRELAHYDSSLIDRVIVVCTLRCWWMDLCAVSSPGVVDWHISCMQLDVLTPAWAPLVLH